MKLYLFFVFSLWSQLAWAAEERNPAQTKEATEKMFAASAAEFGLSPELLPAIARMESGLNPWAVNIAGQGHQCRSREEALGKAEAALAAGKSFDLGLMQINRWWLDKFGLSLETVLEPETNIRLAGWILKQELERWGDLRKAVGAYHSPRPRLAEPYADRVLADFTAASRKTAGEGSPFSKIDRALEISRGLKVLAPGYSMKVRKRDEQGYE